MNERTTLEKIAPSVDEAIAEGLADLGLPREAVDVEVLDEGSRGLFGLGGRQVRVRLTIKGTQVFASLAGQPVPDETPAGENDLLHLSQQTVTELLDKMKIRARLEVRYDEPDEEGRRPVHVDIRGDDLGVRGDDLSILIGRRAEILNAFQYIVNLIVSKQVEHWVQVVVDVEGYRTRRERQLRQMAQRLADQALKTGHRQILEPMTAGERRIIHLELRDHPDVTTESVGEEPVRKVTIIPK